MRIFASEKVSSIMKKLGMEKGEAIEHNWVTKAIGNAQKKVEGHNFDIRKHLLDYDDVANEQRKYIYNKRNNFLEKENRKETVNQIIEEVFSELIENNINANSIEDIEINDILQRDFHVNINAKEIIKNSQKKDDAIKKCLEEIKDIYKKNISELSEEIYLDLIKEIFINIIDKSWIEHIQAMDYLRQGIGLRSYAQKNPKQEYKREAFEMFAIMQNNVHYSFISMLFRLDYKLNFEKKESDNKKKLIQTSSENKANKKSNTIKNSQKRSRKSKKKRKK
jgi:preprotein translocase subunit SecA